MHTILKSLVACMMYVSLAATAIDLRAYQTPQGAITVFKYGNYIDPYFAMKALWTARQFGDISPNETLAWINWALPKQEANGSFSRYCQNGNQWEKCADADADDATLALWIALLYDASPRVMPSAWRDSIKKSEYYLARLKNNDSGVYQISANFTDQLLMDNSEIYQAFRRIGDIKTSEGNKSEATRYYSLAKSLRLAMSKTFSADESRLLKWTSGAILEEKFYPHQVAHLYPWIHSLATDGFGNVLSWEQWLQLHETTWLTRRDDVFPWGILCLLAYQKKSYSTLNIWLDNANSIRDTGYWTVLEESVFQSLSRVKLEQRW